MNVTPFGPPLGTSSWFYLPLKAAPLGGDGCALLCEDDSGGPLRLVLCSSSDKALFRPYMQLLHDWQNDCLTHPQPVVPVQLSPHGICWFSPEGAREDFPDQVSWDSSCTGCAETSTRLG